MTEILVYILVMHIHKSWYLVNWLCFCFQSEPGKEVFKTIIKAYDMHEIGNLFSHFLFLLRRVEAV